MNSSKGFWTILSCLYLGTLLLDSLSFGNVTNNLESLQQNAPSSSNTVGKQDGTKSVSLTTSSMPLINVTSKPVPVWLGWGGASCFNPKNGNCSTTNNATTFGAAEYACSMPGGPGDWGNGRKYFFDPIPYGNVLASVDLTFSGRFFCDEGGSKAMYIVTINDMLISWNTLPDNLQGCTVCGAQGMCMQNATFSSNQGYSDYSTYRYGQFNMLELTLIANNICLYGINLTLFYTPIEIKLAQIVPDSGPTTGGTLVHVIGSGFVGPANNGTLNSNNTASNTSTIWCKFGDLAVPATYINQTMIACKTPTVKVAGNVTVFASNNGQYYSTSFVEFMYYSDPVPPDKDDGFTEMLKKYWYICLAAGLFVLCFLGVILIVLLTRRKSDVQSFSINHETSPLMEGGTFANYYGKDIKEDIDYREIQLAERIGRGNFGEVYKGHWRGTVVAIKKTKLPTATTENEAKEFLEDFEREAKIMRTLRHPNVLQFLGICKVPSTAEICIITEFMSRGNLNKMLHDKSNLMSWELRLRIAIDVSRGMNYLHKSNPIIIHRDLKSYNLLVDDNYKVKVCDFGLAKLFTQPDGKHEMTSCGTPAWTAPEVLRNENYTERADIFSFGVVLWELVTREEPHHGMPPFQVVFAVGTQGVRPSIPSTCPDELHHLIEECWNENPNERPTFDEIMKRLEQMQHLNWI